MSQELFVKLSEELGREPTDDEMADAMSSEIIGAHERATEAFILSRDEAMENFDAVMKFQYGDAEESEKAWNKLKEAKTK